MQAYCFRCEMKTDIKDAELVTLKDGRAATKGACLVCGAKVFRIGGRNSSGEMTISGSQPD